MGRKELHKRIKRVESTKDREERKRERENKAERMRERDNFFLVRGWVFY